MVNIASNAAKLISTSVNEKTGTTVKKFVTEHKYTPGKVLATVVEYGENTPLKKRGIDAFVKVDGTSWEEALDRALISNDTVVLSGSSKKECFNMYGDFKARFKKMIEAFKNDPQIKAEQIDGLGLGVPYHQTLGDGLLYKGSKRI